MSGVFRRSEEKTGFPQRAAERKGIGRTEERLQEGIAMVIYQALSTYQILECIEHRYLHHKEDKCGLILGNYISERFRNYRQLESFFDELYLFRFGGYHGKAESILQEVEEEVGKTIPYPLQEIDRFYIAGIHTYLQVYMLEKGISFAMFEDGSGALSRPWILAEITRKNEAEKYEIIDSYHLYTHESDLISQKYCDLGAQLPGFADEKAVDFNILTNFQKLPKERQARILSFFGIREKINVGKDKTLILTQQFANLGQLSFEGQVLIYQELMDFYLEEDEPVWKVHPDDIMYYDLLFPESVIIDQTFPSELIPFAFSDIPKKIVTVSSTGIHLIGNMFERQLQFNELYERSFQSNYLYLTALKLLEWLGAEEAGFLGGNELQFRNLADNSRRVRGKVKIQDADADILVCDDYFVTDGGMALQKYREHKADTVIFLNSNETYSFYKWADRSVFEEMLPVIIEKEKVSEREYYDEPKEHVIYILTRREEAKGRCRKFTMEEKLEHEGSEIRVSGRSETEREIKMLEGRLAATERRLLQYIENEKLLLERLKEYEGTQ